MVRIGAIQRLARVCEILVGVSLPDVAILFHSGADYEIARDLLFCQRCSLLMWDLWTFRSVAVSI